MTTQNYKQLFELLRQFQIEDCTYSGRLWETCETLLEHLQPRFTTQNVEQPR